ncbi:hypothetical protein niasHT_019346 [Heterodera trifolii]|uniref:Uncharacterized protein n=1 Tax=Heterodera trifolii TaxID=157864 RepID=A0ABD2L6Y0_9BILA
MLETLERTELFFIQFGNNDKQQSVALSDGKEISAQLTAPNICDLLADDCEATREILLQIREVLQCCSPFNPWNRCRYQQMPMSIFYMNVINDLVAAYCEANVDKRIEFEAARAHYLRKLGPLPYGNHVPKADYTEDQKEADRWLSNHAWPPPAPFKSILFPTKIWDWKKGAAGYAAHWRKEFLNSPTNENLKAAARAAARGDFVRLGKEEYVRMGIRKLMQLTIVDAMAEQDEVADTELVKPLVQPTMKNVNASMRLETMSELVKRSCRAKVIRGLLQKEVLDKDRALTRLEGKYQKRKAELKQQRNDARDLFHAAEADLAAVKQRADALYVQVELLKKIAPPAKLKKLALADLGPMFSESEEDEVEEEEENADNTEHDNLNFDNADTTVQRVVTRAQNIARRAAASPARERTPVHLERAAAANHTANQTPPRHSRSRSPFVEPPPPHVRAEHQDRAAAAGAKQKDYEKVEKFCQAPNCKMPIDIYDRINNVVRPGKKKQCWQCGCWYHTEKALGCCNYSSCTKDQRTAWLCAILCNTSQISVNVSGDVDNADIGVGKAAAWAKRAAAKNAKYVQSRRSASRTRATAPPPSNTASSAAKKPRRTVTFKKQKPQTTTTRGGRRQDKNIEEEEDEDGPLRAGTSAASAPKKTNANKRKMVTAASALPTMQAQDTHGTRPQPPRMALNPRFINDESAVQEEEDEYADFENAVLNKAQLFDGEGSDEEEDEDDD